MELALCCTRTDVFYKSALVQEKRYCCVQVLIGRWEKPDALFFLAQISAALFVKTHVASTLKSVRRLCTTSADVPLRSPSCKIGVSPISHSTWTQHDTMAKWRHDELSKYWHGKLDISNNSMPKNRICEYISKQKMSQWIKNQLQMCQLIWSSLISYSMKIWRSWRFVIPFLLLLARLCSAYKQECVNNRESNGRIYTQIWCNMKVLPQICTIGHITIYISHCLCKQRFLKTPPPRVFTKIVLFYYGSGSTL